MTGAVIGVDPGTRVTGYGIVSPNGHRRARLVECGVIRADPRLPLANRLNVLFEGLAEVISHHRPAVLAVESVFYAKNVKTTVALGHARGAVLLAASRAGLEVAEFPPATVKKTITGMGSARKAQMGFMVQQLLHLEAPPEPDDAADGVAVALTYLMTRRP